MEDLVDALESAGSRLYRPCGRRARAGRRAPLDVAQYASPAKAQRPARRAKAASRQRGTISRKTPIDALLGEQPAPNPDMAEMWLADPELWARLSEGGRETLSRSMFGDCRAAAEGYFRGEHYAG